MDRYLLSYISFKNTIYFFNLVRAIPKPVQAPAAVVLDDVTNGYVPKSTSNKEPWAPSHNIDLPAFELGVDTLHCQ
jgi:hypothetical protein